METKEHSLLLFAKTRGSTMAAKWTTEGPELDKHTRNSLNEVFNCDAKGDLDMPALLLAAERGKDGEYIVSWILRVFPQSCLYTDGHDPVWELGRNMTKESNSRIRDAFSQLTCEFVKTALRFHPVNDVILVTAELSKRFSTYEDVFVAGNRHFSGSAQPLFPRFFRCAAPQTHLDISSTGASTHELASIVRKTAQTAALERKCVDFPAGWQ
jgi:hypothetical protein